MEEHMSTHRYLLILPAVMLLLALATSLNAQMPQVISYQGRLTDDAGQPITGAKLIKFKIYGSESGSDSLWSSGYQVVQIENGLFKYELGSNVPLPPDLFGTDDPRYLGVTVDTDAELAPRTQFISVPYALHAQSADSINGAGYVKKTGDTISGHLYFDNNGLGKEAELLLFTGYSIMNFYEGSSKRITLEGEFGTFVLRQADGDLSLWLSGGEEQTEGGSIRLYNSDGASQVYLDGDRTGDGSVMLTDGSINADEMLNEPGIAYNSQTGTMNVTSSSMTDLITVSITIPTPGYVHVTGKAVVDRYCPSAADTGYCGAYLQIDTASGGSWIQPYYSYVQSWLRLEEITTLSVERNFYLNSAGTYQFRLEASRYSWPGDCNIAAFNRSITAVYYPTTYMARE
jgi:hypothetical protein